MLDILILNTLLSPPKINSIFHPCKNLQHPELCCGSFPHQLYFVGDIECKCVNKATFRSIMENTVVLASCSCCNKIPKSGWLRMTEIYCLTFLERRNTNLRCWQGQPPSDGPVSALPSGFWQLLDCGSVTPVFTCCSRCMPIIVTFPYILRLSSQLICKHLKVKTMMMPVSSSSGPLVPVF